MSDNPANGLDSLTDGPPDAHWTLLLAHGAGQGMDSPFMAHIAGALGQAGMRVIRFEFPYMAQIRRTGKRTPPNREPVLLERWNRVIDQALAAGTDARRLLIGGKSLGGRMASLIADKRGAAGLVCLGYPFHPPGKPDRLRTEQLRGLSTPTLICQGSRDLFGTPDEVAGCGSPHQSGWPGSRMGITVSSRADNPAEPGSRTWIGRQRPFLASSRRCEREPSVCAASGFASRIESDARKKPIPPAYRQDATCCRVGLTRAAS